MPLSMPSTRFSLLGRLPFAPPRGVLAVVLAGEPAISAAGVAAGGWESNRKAPTAVRKRLGREMSYEKGRVR